MTEYEEVEHPFIDQLISMGWKWTTGNTSAPSATGRETFRDVILREDLRRAIKRINRDDTGKTWLDDGRINQAISALERIGAPKLIEANETATKLLLKGAVVEGIPGWDGGRERTVHYIDWENPHNNTFRAINQFRVAEPGGQAHRFIDPDIVLFVNGLPLVVVECKARSHNTTEQIEEAVDQLQRYSNQRERVDGNEGNERLFHTNQFVVATCYDEARAASVTAESIHYLEWKDTSPTPMAEVAASRGKQRLSSQEVLVAGMLRPAHLLDIARHFIVFDKTDGKTIKKVARYQQFRAVNKAVERLETGKTREQDGEHDRRGGIIWHTQGSGKSLSMVFLVKKLRTNPNLRRFKVVIVTDRNSLQKQLSGTAELSGEPVKVGKKIAEVKSLLAERGPGLVFAMIQKYQERDHDEDDAETGDDGDDGVDTERDDDAGAFSVLNEDDSILVIVDEAHRSHANTLHGNLLTALPNCARIGFTGTPIIMGAQKRTHEIFGAFIDRYTIRQSEEDGATIPILYEGRTTKGAVDDGRNLDTLFVDMFQGWSDKDLERLKAKYATKGHVMEAPQLIEAKARDILRHYVDNILPNGFKAQVVAVSRRATVLYQAAFEKARAELVEKLARFDPDEEKVAKEREFLLRARRHSKKIRELEFAAVISGSHNDDGTWTEWTDRGKVEARIQRFKKPLLHENREKRDPLAFLIVKSMLLTGFDAPVEQVMYLDRNIKEAELLQAIARVNRTYPNKRAGIIVDYYGVARHLHEALSAYAEEDVEGALKSLKDEIPKLRDRHKRVLELLKEQGLEGIEDEEACVQSLRDERARASFHVLLKQFFKTLEVVLPRPEALPYVADAKQLGAIHLKARNRYRDDQRPIGKDVGEKVRQLIDDHVISKGIDPAIPPVSILDADFGKHVSEHRTSKAKASEMEHAMRHHIRAHFEEDPELYKKFSEKLEGILAQLKGRWDELVKTLGDFVQEVRSGRQKDETGLDPETQAPFLGVVQRFAFAEAKPNPKQMENLCRITVELVDHIQQEIRLVGFWQNKHHQKMLRTWIVDVLDREDIVPWERLEELADRLVELAKVNHGRLVR